MFIAATANPDLPPVLHARAAATPWTAALDAAASGADPGTLFYAPLTRRCTAALILAPDRPVSDLIVLQLAGLALREALLGLLPPHIPVEPALDTMDVNGATAGTIQLARAPGDAAIPDWLVLGFDIAVALGDPNPGLSPDRTDLTEEGAHATATEVLETASRHLLVWLDRWQEEGDPAITQAWQARQ